MHHGPPRSPCCAVMLNYTAQKLGRLSIILSGMCGRSGLTLIALCGAGVICVLAEGLILIDVSMEGPYLESLAQRTPGLERDLRSDPSLIFSRCRWKN